MALTLKKLTEKATTFYIWQLNSRDTRLWVSFWCIRHSMSVLIVSTIIILKVVNPNLSKL